MSEHSQFYYDILKTFAEALMVEVFYVRDHNEDWSTPHGDTTTILNAKTKGGPYLRHVEFHVPIPVKTSRLYRALIELEKTHGVKNNVTEEMIAAAVPCRTPREILMETC